MSVASPLLNPPDPDRASRMLTFKEAAEKVKSLSQRPTDSELLELYSLFKQATEGDVAGTKPGWLDIKGRKKFEAWEKKRGLAKAEAENRYTALVESLMAKQG